MPNQVSVIVPNYNHAPYLRQRLDSIFNQTFQDFEVIILDDCSTDNSKEIIEEYRNRLQVSHVVYNETNSGSPFKQWAKGFNLAQGEYIWIAESDDWAEKNFLEKLIPILDNDSTLQLAYCDSILEYKDKSIYPTEAKASQRLFGEHLLKHIFSFDNAICNASSVIFRKSTAQSISSEYQNFFGSGDYFFWVLLAEKGDFYFFNQSLNHFRQHESNTTSLNRKRGGLYKENYEIHQYLKQQKYISWFENHLIVLQYIKRIETDISQIESSGKPLLEAKKLWQNEIFSVPTSKIIVKLGMWIWSINPFKRKNA